jgi:hypothetical protein
MRLSRGHSKSALDLSILVSSTYHNDQHYFKGLPLDVEDGVIEPTVESAQIMMDKVDNEGVLYNEYSVP